MEATNTTTANLLGLPEKSAEFFAALAADAGNWSGCPWLSGNLGPGRSSSGMSQTLVRAGLITLGEDDGDVYAMFTEAGCAAAAKLGFELWGYYGYEAPVVEAPPAAEAHSHCPECGWKFSAPRAGTCRVPTACQRRQAAR